MGNELKLHFVIHNPMGPGRLLMQFVYLLSLLYIGFATASSSGTIDNDFFETLKRASKKMLEGPRGCNAEQVVSAYNRLQSLLAERQHQDSEAEKEAMNICDYINSRLGFIIKARGCSDDPYVMHVLKTQRMTSNQIIADCIEKIRLAENIHCKDG